MSQAAVWEALRLPEPAVEIKNRGSRPAKRPLPEEARVTYEGLRRFRNNSRNLSRGVILGESYLDGGARPLISAPVAIHRIIDPRDCPNILR